MAYEVWLDRLESEALRHWLRTTAVPMLASMPEGEILWCNYAFERMTGYTWSELEDLKWTELTVDAKDRTHDSEMANELLAGGRSNYQIRKQYRHKTGIGQQVMIDVLRYPAQGDFRFFLVSVIPLDRGYDEALHEVERIHRLLHDFIELQKRNVSIWDRYWLWSKENPTKSFAVLLVAAVFILGDRLLEIAKEVMGLFGLDTTPKP